MWSLICFSSMLWSPLSSGPGTPEAASKSAKRTGARFMALWYNRPPRMVKTDSIRLKTRGHTDVHDITSGVQACVQRQGLNDGQVTVFVPGSTASLTTVEFEPGLVKDLREAFERMGPARAAYHHPAAWGGDNGNSHVR